MKRRFLFSFLLVSVVFFSLSGLSEEKKTITIEEMVGVKTISSLAFSPEGESAVFVLNRVNFAKNHYNPDLYLIRFKKNEIIRLTTSEKRDSSPKWSPEGGLIAFLSNRVGKKNQIFLIRDDGGEAWQLTKEKEGVISFSWLSGDTIVYTTREPLPKKERERREKEKKKGFDARVVGKDKRKILFFSIDVKSGKKRKITTADYGVGEIVASPKGDLVAYTTNYTGDRDDYLNYDIFLLDVKTGKARKLTGFPGPERMPRFSPDGRFIAYLAPVDPTFAASIERIYIIPVVGGKARPLTSSFDRTISRFRWSADGKFIYFEAPLGTETHIFRVPAPGGKVERITRGKANYYGFDIDRMAKRMLLVREDEKSLPEVFLLPLSGKGAERKITALNLDLSKRKIGKQGVISWRSSDGLKIEGVLVKPVDYKPGVRYPLIVIVHGGPHGRVRNVFRDRGMQIFAASGYAVLAPNFRGSSGYGNRFGTINRGDLGGGDFRDIMAGVDKVIELGIADPDRLGIMGGSYGGYMTNWAITQTKRFKAAVSMYGIFNFITDFSNSNIPTFEKEYLGYYYWEKLDPYLRRSPFYYVRNIETPVLILHGDADANTFISNSLEMYTALKKLKKRFEFVRYPREGHGISREPAHRIDVLRRALSWFDNYLEREKVGN
ncbi:MAG: S9 family peptidase [Acidobacteria bacterium]|nr:S9 family peptidase [Acidobacteriota bacterium]